ncbi:MAG: phosphoribosylformylglycinamidine synthase subunit PurS [Candidatus Methanomethylicus sp.]|nr:phosphoribosylformylglycinamidine synthase subunit PurS [Candidatus Methanomethylicus sp.]
MIVKIEVKLKPGHFDPEGDVTAKSLRDLGFKVEEVKVSKVYTLNLLSGNAEEAVNQAKDMCKKLLANPTKDNFTVEVLGLEKADNKKS